MIQKYKALVIRLTKIIISIVIIFFIVRYVRSNASLLNNFKFQINYTYLSFSFLLLIIFIINQSFLWYYITLQNNCNIDLRTSIKYRVYSEFGKYVPGKIFGYVMLFYAYSKENKSKVRVSFCVFFELLANIIASILIFLFSLFCTDIQVLQRYRLVAFLFSLVFFILIHPKIINFFASYLFTITKREAVKIDIGYFQLLKIIFLYIANIMIFGIAFFLFVNSIYSVSYTRLLFLTGTIAAAGVLGLLAIFVPAGLGVREGVLTIALSILIPPALAGVIALLSRLWLTFAEVLVLGLIFGSSKIKPKKKEILQP